jgi:arylsulfatase A-like enzyme
MRIMARSFGVGAWAAGAAGVSMAVLNIAAEMLRGGSVLGWRDLPRSALWYTLVWSFFAAAWGILNALRTAVRVSSPHRSAVPLGFPLYLAAWLFILGYIHLYWLPVLFSTQSLAWTLFLVLCAGVGYWLGARVIPARLTERGLARLTGVLALVLLASFAGNLFWQPPAPHKQEGLSPGPVRSGPNVLLITLDAVRPDHLSCYGYPRASSPNLDRFAAGATVFLQAFAPSSYTMESAPSLFTSTYPSCHGLHSYSDALPRSLPILPETFHGLGYRTAVFSTIRNVSPVYGFGRGVDDFFGRAVDPMNGTLVSHFLERLAAAELPMLSGFCRSLLGVSQALFATEDRIRTEDPLAITEKVASWIQETGDSPFFAYIHYRGAHRDYTPPAPYDRLFSPAVSDPPVPSYPRGKPSFPPFTAGTPMPDRARAGMIAQYDGEIRQHDEALGRLLAFLDDSGLAESTIIVITAVHGEEFYEHGGWGHGQSLHDELIHVPLVWRVPGLEARPGRIDRLVSLIDIFPTLCSLCGIPHGDGLRPSLGGQDLSPLLSGSGDFGSRDYVYAELHQGGHQAQALRTASYKAIRVRYGRQIARLMYDLNEDPGELHPSPEEGPESWARILLEMEAIRHRACPESLRR